MLCPRFGRWRGKGRARCGRGLGILCVALTIALPPGRAAADPRQGEARSITRDVDRPYVVTAGEADAAAAVNNPSLLGLLSGVDAVLDGSFATTQSGLRGAGVGAYLGFPLFFTRWLGERTRPLFSVGIGAQWLAPAAGAGPGAISAGTPAIETADAPYGKLTAALAVPLAPLVDGLSLGLSVSRLVSRRNLYAEGMTAVDAGLVYWANRFVAVGLAARSLNQPRVGPSGAQVVDPLVLEPELAIRPLGRRELEVGLAARTYPTRRIPGEPRFRVGVGKAAVEPRGRLLVRAGPVEVFAQVDAFRYFPRGGAVEAAEPTTGVRLTAGLGVAFEHVAASAGALAGFAVPGVAAAAGGVARVHLSTASQPGIAVHPRRVDEIPLAGKASDRALFEVVEVLGDVERRRGTALLDLRGLAFSYAQIEEIRQAVARVRASGGRVLAYLEGGGLAAYFLASAADRIVAHPHRGLEITGMRARTFYFAELLHRLGARPEFLRIAEYKAVPESYHRMGASEPVRRQRRRTRADVWNHVLRRIARGRNQDVTTVRRWIDQAPHTPDEAHKLGIVDELAYRDELDEVMERWLGHPVRLAKPRRRRRADTAFGDPPTIAVLSIEGDLLDGKSVQIPLLGTKVAGAETLVEQIHRLRRDRSVRGVVIRCNTPGGSVSAADDIARALDRLRREKPVVVSMGTACASGGYYIATAGSYLFTQATTLTGSIGIFYPKVDLSGTLDLLGVAVEEEGFGRRSKMRSWWKPYGEDERAAAMAQIRASYDLFVRRVAKARATTPEDVDRRLARGRVFAGVRALEVGLADRYGGIREAVLRVREMARLRRGDVRVVFVPPGPGLVDRVVSIFGWRIPLPRLHAPGAATGTPWRGPLLDALRALPPSLYLSPGPVPLALDPAPMVFE